ncbi:MAG: ATP-binding protein, partial [Methanobacterium sp.]
TREELLAEIDELKLRLLESEETLNAIQSGEVDALVVDTPNGSQTFTLEGADYIYRVLIEHMNQGVAILTTDYTIYYCNSQLASMSKVPLEMMIGRKISDFIWEDENNKYDKLLKKCSIESCKEETTFKAEDGTVLPTEIFTQFLEDVNSIYMIITDLSYFKHAEKQLKETIDELERSNEELQSFAYITSHDLQEPLRTMGNYAGLLKHRYGGQLDSDADDFLDFMASGAARLQDMITGLLEYSSVGTQGGVFKKFNAEEALNTALTNLKSPIEECHTEITHDPLPEITADKSQITRVFQNLISNALKFRKKGIRPKIHISARKKGNEYVFSVSDNGIGLEEQYSDRIFEVFKRLHTIGEYQGAGIGLAIIKRIIDLHNGRVWVESEFGVGSTFYFTIPIVRQSEK